MKKALFLFVIFTFTLLTASSNFAQKAQRKDLKKSRSIMAKLNLTDTQQKKIDQLHYDQEEKAIDLRSKLQKNRLEIQKLLNTPNFNQNDLINLTKNASDLRSSMMESRVKTWLAVYNILDDKQKVEWSKHFSRMENEFGGKGFEGRKSNRQNMRKGFMSPHTKMDQRDKTMDQENSN